MTDDERVDDVITAISRGLGAAIMPFGQQTALRDAVAKHLRAVRREEREACAVIANAWAREQDDFLAGNGIAARIRARPE